MRKKKKTNIMKKIKYCAPRIDEAILESSVIMEIITLSQGEGQGPGVAEGNKREDRSNTKESEWGNLW